MRREDGLTVANVLRKFARLKVRFWAKNTLRCRIDRLWLGLLIHEVLLTAQLDEVGSTIDSAHFASALLQACFTLVQQGLRRNLRVDGYVDSVVHGRLTQSAATSFASAQNLIKVPVSLYRKFQYLGHSRPILIFPLADVRLSCDRDDVLLDVTRASSLVAFLVVLVNRDVFQLHLVDETQCFVHW